MTFDKSLSVSAFSYISVAYTGPLDFSDKILEEKVHYGSPVVQVSVMTDILGGAYHKPGISNRSLK